MQKSLFVQKRGENRHFLTGCGAGTYMLTSTEGCVLTGVMAIMKSNLVQTVENQWEIRLPIVNDVESLIRDCSHIYLLLLDI